MESINRFLINKGYSANDEKITIGEMVELVDEWLLSKDEPQRGIKIVRVGVDSGINGAELASLIATKNIGPVVVCVDDFKIPEPIEFKSELLTRGMDYEPMINEIPEAKKLQHNKHYKRHHNKSKW
jgi:hypothetical protein